MEETLKKVNTLVFDIDGVLTDGKFYVDELGHFRKGFLDKDFAALRELKKHFRIVLISASEKVNEHVGKMLGVLFYYEPHDKKKKLKELMRKWGIGPNNVLFVGDGYVDIKCTHLIPLSFCPMDAVPELRNSSSVVTLDAYGGEGVAIEIYEILKPEIMRRRKHG
jgi:3-deoxy-D-manno-octulosonate 8-phosphate phosphatase (KDO 8-P phosphatase)